MTNLLTGVSDLYSSNIRIHGPGPASVGWRNEEAQQLRFAKLVEVIDREKGFQGISVNDLGCGYGAMFRFIDEYGAVRLARYYGYDISEEMLAAAKQYVPDTRATFKLAAEITTEADYSFVSGTYNVKLDCDSVQWTSYIEKSLENLNLFSRFGFSFNLMSTYVDWKQENLYYADPFHFFDFCKRNFSPFVSLLHDYPLYEWTLLVKKE